MKTKKLLAFAVMLSLVLTSCDGGSKLTRLSSPAPKPAAQPAPVAPPPVVARPVALLAAAPDRETLERLALLLLGNNLSDPADRAALLAAATAEQARAIAAKLVVEPVDLNLAAILEIATKAQVRDIVAKLGLDASFLYKLLSNARPARAQAIAKKLELIVIHQILTKSLGADSSNPDHAAKQALLDKLKLPYKL